MALCGGGERSRLFDCSVLTLECNSPQIVLFSHTNIVLEAVVTVRVMRLIVMSGKRVSLQSRTFVTGIVDMSDEVASMQSAPRSAQFADFTIIAENGQRFDVHKAMLALRSDVSLMLL